MREFTEEDSIDFLAATFEVLDDFVRTFRKEDCAIHRWLATIFATSIVKIFAEIRETREVEIDKDKAASIIYSSINRVISDFANTVMRSDFKEMH